MTRYLDVYFKDLKAGTLIQGTDGTSKYSYNNEYLRDGAASAISFSMLLSEKPYLEQVVRPFFSGLLPDEGARQRLADGESINLHFRSLVTLIPRSPSPLQVAEILDEMEMLREEVINLLEMQMKTEDPGGNAAHNERHIQNSNPDSITESEPLYEKEQGQKLKEPAGRQPVAPELKSFPLGMVLQACPQIGDYGPGGAIANWRELMAAAVVVRSMLGVSPSAYQEACEILGPENAATVMACMLERAGHINSAGGYLRSLTDRARKGEFALGPMLMALLRTNGVTVKKTG